VQAKGDGEFIGEVERHRRIAVAVRAARRRSRMSAAFLDWIYLIQRPIGIVMIPLVCRRWTRPTGLPQSRPDRDRAGEHGASRDLCWVSCADKGSVDVARDRHLYRGHGAMSSRCS